MANFFPAAAVNTSGNQTTFMKLQQYINEQLEAILNSPIYRGRSGANLTSMSLNEYSRLYPAKNKLNSKATLFSVERVKKFLEETKNIFTREEIENLIEGDADNIGIKNATVFVTNDLDENEYPIPFIAEPIVLNLYKDYSSYSYILYFLEGEEKGVKFAEYKLTNLGNAVNIDGKSVNQLATQKFYIDGKSTDGTQVETKTVSNDLRGPKGDAAIGNNYALGIGLSFFKGIYPSKSDKQEKNTYNIWDELHRPTVYTAEVDLESGVNVIEKNDEPSEKERYILDLKIIDFDFNGIDASIQQEVGYKVIQWEEFAVDLLKGNIKTEDGHIVMPTSGKPSYIRLDSDESVVYSEPISSDIEASVITVMSRLDMNMWNAEDIKQQGIYPQQYKCIIYNDILLYDVDPVLQKCSYFNYNNAIFKLAWHAYHRMIEFDGLGDKDSYKYDTEKNIASYSVALNACWNVVDKMYEGRSSVLRVICYDIFDDENPYPNTGDFKRFQPGVNWKYARLAFDDDAVNTYMCVDFTIVDLKGGEVDINAADDVSVKGRALCVETNCLNGNKEEDGVVVGTGGGHGSHLFGMTKDQLFTWMHSSGDIVIAETSTPSWSIIKGKDDMPCWEKIEIPANSALSIGAASSSLGSIPSNPDKLQTSITNNIPNIHFANVSLNRHNGTYAHQITSGSVVNNDKQGSNLYITDDNVWLNQLHWAKDKRQITRSEGRDIQWKFPVSCFMNKTDKIIHYPADFQKRTDTSSTDFNKPTQFNEETGYSWYNKDANPKVLKYIDTTTLNIEIAPSIGIEEPSPDSEGTVTNIYYIAKENNFSWINGEIHVSTTTADEEESSIEYETIKIFVNDANDQSLGQKEAKLIDIITSLSNILIKSNNKYIYYNTLDTSVDMGSGVTKDYVKCINVLTTASVNNDKVSVNANSILAESDWSNGNNVFYDGKLNDAYNISYTNLRNNNNNYLYINNAADRDGYKYSPTIYSSSTNDMINQYVVNAYRRTGASVNFVCDSNASTTYNPGHSNEAPSTPGTSECGCDQTKVYALENTVTNMNKTIEALKKQIADLSSPSDTPSQPTVSFPSAIKILKWSPKNGDGITNPIGNGEQILTFYYQGDVYKHTFKSTAMTISYAGFGLTSSYDKIAQLKHLSYDNANAKVINLKTYEEHTTHLIVDTYATSFVPKIPDTAVSPNNYIQEAYNVIIYSNDKHASGDKNYILIPIEKSTTSGQNYIKVATSSKYYLVVNLDSSTGFGYTGNYKFPIGTSKEQKVEMKKWIDYICEKPLDFIVEKGKYLDWRDEMIVDKRF